MNTNDVIEEFNKILTEKLKEVPKDSDKIISRLGDYALLLNKYVDKYMNLVRKEQELINGEINEYISMISKAMENGWEVLEVNDNEIIMRYPNRIDSDLVQSGGIMYRHGYESYVEDFIVIIKDKTIVNAYASNAYHINVSSNPSFIDWLPEKYQYKMCLGDYDNTGMENLTKVPELYKINNMDSSYEGELFDMLYNDIDYGELEKVGEVF